MVELAKNIIISLCAVVGVFTYFYDNNLARERQKTSSSLAYISEVRGEEMRRANDIVFRFWQGDSQRDFLLNSVSNGSIEERRHKNYFTALIYSGNISDDVRSALFDFAFFYDEVWFCRKNGNCNEKLLDDFLCVDIVSFYDRFELLYKYLKDENLLSNLAVGLEAYVEDCR